MVRAHRPRAYISVLLALITCIFAVPLSRAQGSCESFNSDFKYRNGDQCQVGTQNYSINPSDDAGLTSDYASIGDGGVVGNIYYKWTPPEQLKSVNIRIRGSIKNNSSGTLDISLWNGDNFEKVKEVSNSRYSTTEYIKVNISSNNENYIDGGNLRVELRSDDGWWVDDVKATWTTAPAISVNPEDHDFGSVEVGTTAQKEVTINNPGDAELRVTPSIGGSDPGGFASIESGTELSIPSGGSETVTVEFQPQTEDKAYQAELQLDHNVEGRANPFPVLLGGYGAPAPDPGISVSPESHDFGSVEVGTTAQKEVTISNPGDAELRFTPSIGGSNPGAFAVIGGGTEVSVPSGGSETVTVEFQPQTADEVYNADLELDHNGA